MDDSDGIAHQTEIDWADRCAADGHVERQANSRVDRKARSAAHTVPTH
jgi:hypothetical protein